MKEFEQKCDTNYHNNIINIPGCGEKSQPYQSDSQQTYSLINEEISLPAAVIQQSRISNNLDWMQRFAATHNVKLCPHGKTSMTPALFRQQLDQGAWGMTVATAAQAEVAALAGATNIIIANQLVGKANMAIVANLIEQHGVDVFVCVDSQRNVEALGQFFTSRDVKLNVLIEFGVEGGRCGCRTEQQVAELAQCIAEQSHLSLTGIEAYEGVIHGDNAEQAIRDFLNQIITLTRKLARDQLILGKPIVTGAGSAWYDVVSECFANLDDLDAIIRPGCYAIHDTGIYLEAQNKVMARAEKNQGAACDLGGDLQSSLEVWAHVISKPEPGKLVVGLGKRDVAFDAGLPIPERAYRDGEAISVSNAVTTAVMDQHAFMEIDPDCPLDVGDVIAFSTSHPCLTFDKWRAIAVCDDEYNVTHWVETRF
ncbi:amino acid deaminase [Vibrio europaeus]|uniref:amino acid deaminase n=1 Tax=Vibrio europaeus TaxID=300876 RepID=UPI00233EA189|nr:amino acid deaminase [Vibrio europaeus]MDC5818908.1 amino acid deaminase [Vibrio europaeus]MDC5871068.1 amino acid deaminase [Vibrio europaeus]